MQDSSKLNRFSAPTLLFLTAIILTALPFSTPVAELWANWQRDEYSHGPLIPVIALLLVLHRLSEKPPSPQPSWWGAALVLPALAMLTIGSLSTFNVISLYGLVLALVGMSVAFLGIAATRQFAPALVYLLFAIPLPNILYAGLSSDLQLISSTLGVSILNLLGLSVYQEGNVIDLGVFKLQVVEACSGLRYLFPLMSFGYLAAYLFRDRLWKRVLLFLSTIPITIGMNSLRIALIGVTADLWGIEMASGLIHDFEGWSIFLVCVAVLMGEMFLLARIGTRGSIHFETLSLPRPPFLAAPMKGNAASATALGLVIIAGIAFGSGLLEQRQEIIPAHRPLANFPLKAGEWEGRRGSLDRGVLDVLQLSDYWIADYARSRNDAPVNLYIAYYASQRVGASTHSPSSCIPGGGWRITSNSDKVVSLGGTALTVKRIMIRKGEIKQLVYYWFDERGRNITGQIAVKWWLLHDSIFAHRSDGSLIRLVTPVADGESDEDAETRLIQFLATAYPPIRHHLPQPIMR